MIRLEAPNVRITLVRWKVAALPDRPRLAAGSPGEPVALVRGRGTQGARHMVSHRQLRQRPHGSGLFQPGRVAGRRQHRAGAMAGMVEGAVSVGVALGHGPLAPRPRR